MSRGKESREEDKGGQKKWIRRGKWNSININMIVIGLNHNG